MLQHFTHTFGISLFSNTELVMLIGSLYCTCAFSGVLADLLLRDAAFGAVANGFLMFVFMLMLLVGYNELVQHVRLGRPLVLLSMTISLALVLLFAVAMLKNRMMRA